MEPAVKITVKAHIKRVSDGLVRIHEDDWTQSAKAWADRLPAEGPIAGALHGIEYWWNEGNGSCDCNKRLFFHAVANEEVERFDGEDDRYCIGDGRFKLDRLVAYVETEGIIEEFELSTEEI